MRMPSTCISQTRPCPPLADRSMLWGSSIDCGPVLLRVPLSTAPLTGKAVPLKGLGTESLLRCQQRE